MSAQRVVFLLVCVAACHRDAGESTSRTTAHRELALVAASVDSAGRTVRTLALDDGATGLVVGSFRIAVHYDTSRTVFSGATGNDTLSVAVNDVGGRVLIAGAAARGFAKGEWMHLAFTPRMGVSATVAARALFSLEALELGDLHGFDLRSEVAMVPAYTVRQ